MTSIQKQMENFIIDYFLIDGWSEVLQITTE
jgi:hypothetical protein